MGIKSQRDEMFVEKNTTKMGSPIRSIPVGRGGMIFFIDARLPLAKKTIPVENVE